MKTIMKTLNENNKVAILENSYQFLDEKLPKLEVEKDQTLTIIEIDNGSLTLNQEIIVNENAHLCYIKIGTKNSNTTREYKNSLGTNATLDFHLFDFGNSSTTVTTALENKNAVFTIDALIDINENKKAVYDVQTKHLIQSTSDIKFKNILDEKSSTTINMFSKVKPTASFSKAFQNSQTILLNDDSSIAVTPHLEIDIDELEASHGATCGDLDRDSIYYLQSRGINETDAKQILLNAIRNEVLETLQNEKLQEYVESLIKDYNEL